jgi:hypothetical protein
MHKMIVKLNKEIEKLWVNGMIIGLHHQIQ